MKSNQILIGPSGTGKSSKGERLAEKQGKNFIDFDNDILENISQQTAINIHNILENPEEFNPYQLINTSVANILDLVGVDNFIKIEEYLTLQLNLENTVLATSGSQVLSEKAMKHLNNMGDTIYLNDSLDNIMQRASQMKLNRIVGMPFNVNELSKNEIIKKYKEIMQERLAGYEKYSDITYVNDEAQKNIQKSTIRNKHGIPILDNGKVSINYRKDKQLNFNHFFNFLKKQGIVKI